MNKEELPLTLLQPTPNKVYACDGNYYRVIDGKLFWLNGYWQETKGKYNPNEAMFREVEVRITLNQRLASE